MNHHRHDHDLIATVAIAFAHPLADCETSRRSSPPCSLS